MFSNLIWSWRYETILNFKSKDLCNWEKEWNNKNINKRKGNIYNEIMQYK